jgi:hypothetical protein
MERLQGNEMVVVIPAKVVGDGEPGEPLTQPVQDLIRAMCKLGYWPSDFGEQYECGDIELWFIKGAIGETKLVNQLSEGFIKNGGAD